MSEEVSGVKPNTRTVSIDGDPFEIEFGAKTYQEQNNCNKQQLNEQDLKKKYESAESEIKQIASSPTHDQPEEPQVFSAKKLHLFPKKSEELDENKNIEKFQQLTVNTKMATIDS